MVILTPLLKWRVLLLSACSICLCGVSHALGLGQAFIQDPGNLRRIKSLGNIET